jgi:hypothetical protein
LWPASSSFLEITFKILNPLSQPDDFRDNVLLREVVSPNPTGRWVLLDHTNKTPTDHGAEFGRTRPLFAHASLDERIEFFKEFPLSRIPFRFVRWQRVDATVVKPDCRLAFDRVPILRFRVADAVWTDRAVPTSDNHDVIIAVVNHALDEAPLILTRGRKQLHSGWHAIKLQRPR